jgi:hypothetical protein
MPCRNCGITASVLYRSHRLHWAQWDGAICARCVETIEEQTRRALAAPSHPSAVEADHRHGDGAEAKARRDDAARQKRIEDDALGAEYREWIAAQSAAGSNARREDAGNG